MTQTLAVWGGGGMGPQRLDRRELRSRLADEAPGWIVDALADAFEPAFLTFRRQVAEAAKKNRRRPRDGADGRRSRQGRPATGDDQ